MSFLDKIKVGNYFSTLHIVRYGELSDQETDSFGNTFFGSGNSGLGYHGIQRMGFDSLGSLLRGEQEMLFAASAKVHYRTGEDVNPDNWFGNDYSVDGGYQQAGVHGASSDRTDRASWNFDYSLFDAKADHDGSYITVSWDLGLLTHSMTYFYNESVDLFVAQKNGNVYTLETGNGPDTVLQDSWNPLFIADLLDNDGNPFNGFQEWDMVHGDFDITVGQIGDASTSVHIGVGDMLIA